MFFRQCLMFFFFEKEQELRGAIETLRVICPTYIPTCLHEYCRTDGQTSICRKRLLRALEFQVWELVPITKVYGITVQFNVQ